MCANPSDGPSFRWTCQLPFGNCPPGCQCWQVYKDAWPCSNAVLEKVFASWNPNWFESAISRVKQWWHQVPSQERVLQVEIIWSYQVTITPYCLIGFVGLVKYQMLTGTESQPTELGISIEAFVALGHCCEFDYPTHPCSAVCNIASPLRKRPFQTMQ